MSGVINLDTAIPQKNFFIIICGRLKTQVAIFYFI